MKPDGRRVWCALIGMLISIAIAPLATAAVGDSFRTEIDLSTKEMNLKETALGDLTADAIRSSAHADIAFIAAASFNDTAAPIRPGAFSSADLLKALEYKNETIAILKLTGEQIRGALAHGLYLYPKANSSFLQTSGLTFTADASAEDAGRVNGIKVNGEPLVASKSYRVAMPMTLANGALAYFKYWKKSDIEKDTGKTLEVALVSYLNEHKILTKGEDRLINKGAQRESGHG